MTIGAPLAGCVMVVTADRRSGELSTALERRGATVHHAPSLSTVPHLDDETLISETRKLIATRPDIIVITTGIGFRGWIEAADAAGLAESLLEVMAGSVLVARGPKARGAIQAAGLAADWVADGETAAEIEEYLVVSGIAGKKIAVQHHGAGSDGLDQAFIDAGATVQPLVVYGWGPTRNPAAHFHWIKAASEGECDTIIFTSAPGVMSWLAGVREARCFEAIKERVDAGELLLATIGPVTAAPLLEVGLATEYPDRWRLGALVRSLATHYGHPRHVIHTVAGELMMRRTSVVLDGIARLVSPSGVVLMRALVEAKGAVLSREQLLNALPMASADTHAVDAAINRLREATGSKSIVRTVVKRGYALGLKP